MAQEYDEEEFQQSGAGWWIHKIGIVAYIALIVAYALQTLGLVNWLFPADNWFMKTMTMFVCDGCSVGYAMAEMFYRFRLRRSKHFVFGMWIVTFILSTVASVVQVYLSSTHTIPHQIDPGIIALTYGVIIAAFVINVIAITVIIRMEHGASQPARRYLDDGLKKRKVAPQQQQSGQLAQTGHSSMPVPVQSLPDTQPLSLQGANGGNGANGTSPKA